MRHPIVILCFVLAVFTACLLIVDRANIFTSSLWTSILASPSATGSLIGSLVGPIVGLFGVAFSAWIGFRSLISAQNHQAELTRNAQEHQADLARARDDEIRNEEKRSFCQAIIGELTANHLQIVAKNAAIHPAFDLLLQQPERAAEIPIDPYISALWPRLDQSVFDSTVGNIGRIDAGATSVIVLVYGQLKDVYGPPSYQGKTLGEVGIERVRDEITIALSNAADLITRSIKVISHQYPELLSKDQKKLLQKTGRPISL